MSFRYFNPNPENNTVGDCVVRAVALLTHKTWDEAYLGVCAQGFVMKDMPSSNAVWNAYLSSQGFVKTLLPNTCPMCYTVKDFCRDFKTGEYILALDRHVVAVYNGDYYDIWDSGNEVPIFYWRKERN